MDHSKSNSEETICSCNHLTQFAVLVDFSGSTKVVFLLLLLSLSLLLLLLLLLLLSSSLFLPCFQTRNGSVWSIKVLPSFSFVFDAAFRERRSCSGDHHIRRVKPIHHRNTFDNNLIFFPHVSTVIKRSAENILKYRRRCIEKSGQCNFRNTPSPPAKK